MPSLQVVENFPHLQAASRLPVRNDALHRPLQQAAPFLFQAIEGAQCVTPRRRNQPMVRFIARWRRMALTMGFTVFVHARVSEILSFKLCLSDPMSCEIRVDVLPSWSARACSSAR